MELTEWIKGRKKCDIISFFGVSAFAILALANMIRFAVLGEPTPFITATAVSIIFLSCAVFAWKSRLSFLWVLMGVGSIIMFACSNMFGISMKNAVYFVQILLGFCVGAAAMTMQIIERQKPKLAYGSLAALLAVVVFAGSVWGGHTAFVNGKDASAQNEYWAVPDKYDAVECPEKGTVETIEYESKAYATDGHSYEKKAHVYLPYGYDESKRYNILYLMHGTWSTEDYWFSENPNNVVMIDNLIYHGDIKPLIIVTPTWYCEDYSLSDFDELEALTYSFNDELRNDLMPLIESKYSTYARDTSAEAFSESRDHRAFAGLSRGSGTTFHSAINKSLDYFSWFGCFSGFLTSKDEFYEGSLSDELKDYTINYFYNTTGSFDFLLDEHVKGYRWLLEEDTRLKEGVNSSLDIFPMCYHSMYSWHIALYNFLQKIF